jgi:NAD(P)-dependent dehydrogenase (short-subunit alcohol dehydrogenase family)
MSLSGMVAVVTGGTSGLGEAGCKLLASRGARVVAASDQPERAERLLASISAAGGDATFVETDVRSPDDVERLIATTEQRWGRIDVLYASAGVMPTGSAPETSEDDYQLAVDVNLGGCFRLARFGIPALERSGGGSVILTSSELGLVGASRSAAYCAAKGGVVNLVRALAIDAAPLGVRVNCLCPGPIDTPMLRKWLESGDRTELERTQTEPVPMKRFGRPAEIAEAVLFLASDASSFMTGAVLVVDGGVTASYGL